MRKFSVFNKETGVFTGQVFMTNNHEVGDSFARENIADGLDCAEGEFDHIAQKIDTTTGSVVDYKPPQPSVEHEWNESLRRWILSKEAAERINHRSAARARVVHLEANVQPRAVREVALNQPGAVKRLQDIDDEIAGLRKQLGQG